MQSTCNMAVHGSACIAKRPCPTVSSEQLVKRLKLEGVSFPNNVRLATLLDTANAHGLLTLAPEPQVGAYIISMCSRQASQTPAPAADVQQAIKAYTRVLMCTYRRACWTCQRK